MLTLLKTFLDISVLRKRPDSLPSSWLVLKIAVGLWLAGIALMAFISPNADLRSLVPHVGGWACSMLLFALVIQIAGFPLRLAQSLAAIAGAGAVILFGQVLAVGILLKLGQAATANLILEILSLWAVFVKGYIVSATIEIRPILGVGISLIVFILRMLASTSLSSPA